MEFLRHSMKFRSKLPRRKRSQISPILRSSLFSATDKVDSALPLDSTCSSRFSGEISSNSSRVTFGMDYKPRSSSKKRVCDEIGAYGEEQFRRVTRSYNKRSKIEKKNEKRTVNNGELEVSECSCVESCSEAADSRLLISIDSKLKKKVSNEAENFKQLRENEDSSAVTHSEEVPGDCLNSGAGKLKVKEHETVSITSDVQNEAITTAISRSESTTELKTELLELDHDLACTEQFSYDDVSNYASSYEIESETLAEKSETEFSDCSPSIWLETGSEFSEKSTGDSTPSPCFSLFREYSQHFFKSDSLPKCKYSKDEFTIVFLLIEFQLLSLEDEEHEESYQLLRSRERKQAFIHDYAEEYLSTTEFGNLILQQRLLMVNWIVQFATNLNEQQSTKKELQDETLFLGVTLLDRFLSRGFFKTKRYLQLAGMSCLSLATRIEENQPFNSARQKIYHVESNIYSRCEVVAMEWLVQEVLNFQCFLPTINNFLWFYLKAARADVVVEKKAKNLAVLALLDHKQLGFWPSTVAAGLVILASMAANQDESCQRVLEVYLL
ncbi:Cyclin, C-terminal domain [Dillenia turbinata]|uniref:Cyclin, C-terminal domain n=1 Tax=Dillenia turbinata TaxID=194707 RepID=A0AAN8UTN0_9MAGN